MQLSQTSVNYLGHVLSDEGIKPDPKKNRAIEEFATPTCKEDLQRFLDSVWIWDTNTERDFELVKQAIMKSPCLKYFNGNKAVTVSVDASKNGLGAVLLQEGQPVAYGSESLTQTQQHYAQIEKELMAVIYGLEHFNYYTYGRIVMVQTDHKPILGLIVTNHTIQYLLVFNATKRCVFYVLEQWYAEDISSVKRHFETNHKSFCEKSEPEQKELIASAIKDINKQSTSMFKYVSKNCHTSAASYSPANAIARHGKLFQEGEFLKEAWLHVRPHFLMILIIKIIQCIKDVTLSRNTMKDRILKLAENVTDHQKNDINSASFVSLCLDESIDITKSARLAVFARYCVGKIIKEELIAITSLSRC
ncbi:retrovirus-related Pol polyprotein from transposon 17.6 [Trichonephila clavipes]|nr:retrovirus-related Pol polyprotein from transposon 17.6 [Trichonephila clavipes]